MRWTNAPSGKIKYNEMQKVKMMRKEKRKEMRKKMRKEGEEEEKKKQKSIHGYC